VSRPPAQRPRPAAARGYNCPMPWGLIILLAIGLGVLWAGVSIYTAWLLTHPPRRSYAWAVSRGMPGDPGELASPLEFTSWTLSSGGMSLPVWDVRGQRASGPVIIVTHGWADSRIVMLGRVGELAALASRVLVWDLPGHGDGPGMCSLGVHEPVHLRALILAARAQEPIVLYGFSLGAGVSIAAAAGEPGTPGSGVVGVVGVIAEAPYRTARVPARNVLRLRGLPYQATLGPALGLIGVRVGRELRSAEFDRARMASRLPADVRLLVIHGEDDAVCPVDDARAIAVAAYGAQLVIVPAGDHTGLWSKPGSRDACRDAVSGFIARLNAATGAVAR